MNKFHHICLNIENELNFISKKQETHLNGSYIEAWNALNKSKSEWKKYFTWCDNEWIDWKCLWHNEK